MGNRLTKIYTKTGDDGTTGLGDGSRVNKDSLRVDAMGEIDELNAYLGLLLTEDIPEDIHILLLRIQHALFDVGAELCIPTHVVITEAHVSQLEVWLDALNESLLPLKNFILPGGTRASALCHVARTICRRAERHLVTLSKESDISKYTLWYINRLSDLLFVIARNLNAVKSYPDVLWQPDLLPSDNQDFFTQIINNEIKDK